MFDRTYKNTSLPITTASIRHPITIQRMNAHLAFNSAINNHILRQIV